MLGDGFKGQICPAFQHRQIFCIAAVARKQRRLSTDALRPGGIFPDFAGEFLYGGGKERLILRHQIAELQSERLSHFKFGLHRADALTDIASDQPHAHFFAKRFRRDDALHHKIADAA